jgi:hypothetical protein
LTTITKEIVTSTNTNQDKIITTPVRSGATKSQTNEYLVYYLFGAIETLLVFRLILKLAGAGINSWFVSIIYTLSKFFVMPFEGIFRKSLNQGIETTSVFEPATIIALIVYSVLAVGIVKLIRILSKNSKMNSNKTPQLNSFQHLMWPHEVSETTSLREVNNIWE